MTDVPTPSSDPTPPAPAAPATASAGRASKARVWRRRISVTLVVLVVVAIVGRFLISIALPLVVDRVVAFYNFSATYDRAELSMSDGNLNLFNLTLRPKEGGEPIAHADFVYGNISPMELLRGRLHVWRLEVDGIDLNVDRNSDGSIPLLQRLVPATAKSTSSNTAPPRPIDLQSPLKVEAFRLSHLNAHIRDRSVSPMLDTVVQLAVRVSDLGTTGKPTTFEVGVSSDQLLEDLRLTGDARLDGKNLDANMIVAIRNLHPKPAAGYLIPAGIRPASDSISMHMNAALSATASASVPGALTGKLALSGLSAEADGQQSIAVDKINIDVDSFTPTALKLAQVLVDGVRISTSRTHEGLLRACGIELVSPTRSGPTTAPSTAPAYAISVASVQLHVCRLDLADQAITPPAALAVQLDQLTIASAPGAGGALAIVGRMSVPGVAKQITLSGSTAPFAPIKTADLKVRVEGLQPTALKPYFDSLGLQSEFTNGTFGFDLTASLSPQSDGSFSADAHLSKLELANGEELLGLNDVLLKGVSLNAQRIRLDSIDGSGPTLTIARDASGAVSLLGLKTKSNPAVAPRTTSTSSATSQPAVARAAAPRLEIGKFIWHGVHVHLEDQAVSPPQTIAIDDVGVELHDLKLGLAPGDYAANTGKLKAWFVAPHFVDRLDLAGTITPSPNALQLDLIAAGAGVSPAALAPYLKPLGIEPLTHDAAFHAHALVELARRGDVYDTSLQLDGFQYASGDQDLLSVDALNIDHARIGGKELPISDVVIDHPNARIERDADGSLIVAGIRLLERKTPVSAPAGGQALSAAQQPSTTPFIGALGSLQIHNAALSWTDRAAHPVVTTSLTSDIDLKNLTIGKPANAADLRIVASIPDVIRQITVTGQVSPAPGAASAHLDIAAGGIVVGPLSAYFPPGVTSTLADGRLKLTLDADVADNPKGGQTAVLLIDGLDYRDGKSDDPLFKMDKLSVIGSRIDPAGGVIALDEVSTRGIELTAIQSPGGAIRALGLSIASPPPTTQPASTEPAAAEAAAPAPAPPAPSGLTTAQIMAADKKPLPLITLGKLDLNVHRISLIDSTRPKAAPLLLLDLRLQNKNRIEWLGPNAATRPPTQLELTTAVAPLADHLVATAKVTPFALHPSATLDLAVTGIHGDGLIALAPELKDQLDGGGMTSGQLDAHIEAVLKLDRHVPTDFDLSRPYALDFSLTNVRFRSSPNSQVLGGLDEVRAEDVRVRPVTSEVEVKSLEITNPALFVVRETDGIHALGWVIKTPTPATQPSTRPASVAKSKPRAPAPALAPVTRTAPKGEIKIDSILASGLDIRIEDRTTKPVTVVPLSALDLEIRDLSSLAPYQDKPFRFNALVNAGKVGLPARQGTGTEQRELFSQISASGKMGLYPQYNGWAKVSVSGFDLTGVTAEAALKNITLTRGAFDLNADLRFDNKDIDVTAAPIFTDMVLSEADDGPIRRWLVLPFTLNAGLVAVRDADGSITIPLHFQVHDGQLTGIGAAIPGAVASVMITAVLNTPAKVVNLFADAFGGGPKKPGQEQPITLAYLPGAVWLESDELSALQLLAQRMINEPKLEVAIQHTFGSADLATLASRANPSPEDARSLAYQLRAHKLELSRLRAQVAGQAEAQLAGLNENDASQTIDRLRAIDIELAQTENSLDHTYDLLRPGAQRQADRRTRAAALEVAAQRLAGVRTLLRSEGVPDVDRRVHLLHPTFTPSDSTPDSSVTLQPVRTRGAS